jgi:hypothetical protein
MMLTAKRRRWLTCSALVAALATGSWKHGGEPATAALLQVEQTQPAKRARSAIDPLPQLEIEKLEIDKSNEPIVNAFEQRSWAPPAPKIKPGPPPSPQAPPLPFTYIGKMMEDGRIVVFLTQGERNFAVRSGDKLDNLYQIDEIKPTMMLLTYLPLNKQQSLPIGGAN